MRSAFTLLTLISLPAFACPQLAGTYKTCRTNSSVGTDVEQIVIEQQEVKKVTQYTFTTHEIETEEARSEKYIADGKIKTSKETDQDTGVTVTTSTTTSCSGEILKIKMNAKMDSAEFADVLIQVSKVGNQLIQQMTGTSLGEPVSETITCEL